MPTSSTAFEPSLGTTARIALALRVWYGFALVRAQVHRRPLSDVVLSLTDARPARWRRQPVDRLSRAVHRSLRIGARQPSCLVMALVLLRLLRQQGDRAVLVLGLPMHPAGHDAHAWIELEGTDVGPSPGRAGHSELARYGDS